MKTIFTLILSCICLQFSYAQQVDFLEHTIFKNEINGPLAIRSADLNNDGYMDHIITSEKENKVFWLKNDGFQNFTTNVLIESCVNKDDFEVADIDSDGDLDILFICYKDLHLLENDGNQNFTDTVIYTQLVWDLLHIGVRDIDLDGDLDIVTHYWNRIFTLKNNGNNNFSTFSISYRYDSDFDFEIVDIDDDGDLDIFGVESYAGIPFSSIRWYENDGSHNFTDTNFTYESQGINSALTVGDIDDDGDKDFVTGASGYDSLLFYNNDGNEYFTKIFIPMSINPVIQDVYIEDIDNDGDKDIIVVGNIILIFENDGLENFTEHPIPLVLKLPNVGTPFTLKDLDSDGDLDLCLISLISDDIVWIENTGNFNFVSHYIQNPPMGYGIDLLITDLDQDSDLDILGYSNGAQSLFWFENDGYENFSLDVLTDTLRPVDELSSLDFDGDGDMDILCGIHNNEYLALAVLINDGFQNFSKHVIVDSLESLNCINNADINNDGNLDLIFNDRFNREMYTYLGDGSGNFTSQLIMDSTQTIISIHIADLEQDGDLDIFAKSIGESFYWLENDGFGDFTQHTFDLTTWHSTCFVEDLDNDGDNDVVLSSMEWLENDGSNNLIPNSLSFSSSRDVEIHDINNDGYMDILTNKLWYKGDSLSNFTAVLPYFHEVSDLFSVDIDADGDMDIFTLSNSLDEIIWRENLMYNNYMKISAVPYVDHNNNGIYDLGDNTFQNVVFTALPQNASMVSVADTTVFFIDTMGVYIISMNLDTALWEATTPTQEQVNVNSTNFYDTLYFGVKPKEDLIISSDITGMWPRCFSNNQYLFTVTNYGSNIDTGYVEIVLDNNVSFVNSIPAPSSVSGDTLSYHFSNLLSSFSENIAVNTIMPQNIIPISHNMKIYADTGQWVMADSIGFLDFVSCSYDPNDKQVFPNYGDAGYILNNQTELEYLIRFQNTGNDTAFVVELKDTLDANLDISTFKLIATSHPYTSVEINSNGVLTFLFNNINLTDTVVNEAESHGFAKFSINAKQNLPLNTIITNEASIYFDMNPPIITNSTINSLYNCDALGNSIEFSIDNSAIIVQIDEPYLNHAYWLFNGDTIHIGTEGFSFLSNANGAIELTAYLENDLCILDTTYTLYVNNVGIVTNAQEGILSIYPNPTNGLVFIDFGEICNTSHVKINTISGQLIQEQKYSSTRLISLNLPEEPGVYLLEIIKENNKSEFVKVINY